VPGGLSASQLREGSLVVKGSQAAAPQDTWVLGRLKMSPRAPKS